MDKNAILKSIALEIDARVEKAKSSDETTYRITNEALLQSMPWLN